MIPAEDEVLALRREVGQLRVVISLFFLALIVVLVLINLISLFKIPQAEKIFEDMLGSRDRLPELTKLVLSYFRLGGGLVSMAVILLPTIVCGVLMFSARPLFFRFVLPTVWSLMLAFHLVVLILAIQMPLMTIIQGINEK